jgi:hypothetical protein
MVRQCVRTIMHRGDDSRFYAAAVSGQLCYRRNPTAGTYGCAIGKPCKHQCWPEFDANMVLNQCHIMHRRRGMDRIASYQWKPRCDAYDHDNL